MAVTSASRRSGPTLSLQVMLFLALLFFTSTASAASAVLGIDLGTNFIKAAIVKPGTPLDIVLTKDSKRKETAAVAFKPLKNGPVELGSFPERLYGGDALALAGRFPGDVYSNLKPLLGIQSKDTATVDGYTSRFPAIQVDTSKSSVAFKSGAFSDKEQPWTVEELLAMELKNIRANAEAVTGKGSRITDAIITVPAFYTADERKAVERAASMAGLSVMSLISDGLAVGVDYSVKREFPNVSRGGKAELHLIFDMGASSTKATVLRFQSRDVKEGSSRFNKTIHEVSVLGTGWDRTLGGNALNGVVLDHLVSEFAKKSDVSSAGISPADVKKHGRTASKLWREAERARQVLSANTDVRSSFEGLYQDIDFSTKLSRAQFEELAAPFADRVAGPVKQALDSAKITTDDLTSVILYGGMVRTPFVQKQLEAIIGKSAEIRSNVNADESAAFGAAFKAAGLSPSFRVKEIRDAEAAIYAAGISHSQNGKERKQQVFIPTSLSGTPKQVQFKDKTDFEFSIYQKVDSEDRLIQKIETKNVTAGVKALGDKFGCTPDEIQTKFLMRLNPLNGVPEVVNGIVTCQAQVTVSKGGIVDSVKGFFGGKKDEQKPLKESESSSSTSTESSSSSASPASASASGKVNKTDAAKEPTTEIRIESILVDFDIVHQGLPVPSKAEVDRMTERLAAFDRSDKARFAREEAFNTLEGFTYRARDLISDSSFEEFSTEAVRSKISDLLSSTSDWLYGEGASATSDVLKKKLAEFTDLIDPVKKRQQEAKDRPEKIKLLQQVLDQTKTLMENVSKDIEKAAKSASSAAEKAASSVSSAVTPESSSAKDDLDDLEEPETSTTTSSAKAEPSNFTPYTKEDLSEITELYESIKQWLEEKVTAQKKLKPFEDAILSGRDLEAKGAEINRVMGSLVQKKIRMPKKTSSKKPKAPKTKKGKSSSSSSSGTSTTSGASSTASPASDAPDPKTINFPEGGKMPTEEEILEMIRKAGGDVPPSPEPPKHEEL
ncbi:Heat shock protein 70 lhs1 [Sphaceloma murrayae]|uniref:Heat shock protein 70 lhs1 n=1 Tax=Sphaceloma murrayae TaxID=2082308 RepID=A0A2K1QJ61_9PEZI|nr:Heat shock protein 70 lhs1 [Sphaceloma murrayae]